MDRRAIFQAAASAAAVATICVVVMGFIIRPPEPGMSLQPSQPAGPVSEFVRPTNEYPALALQFFAGDTLFVLSYVMVFAGLHAAVVDRARAFAGIGLGAGVLTAVLDAAENAFFITYALQAINSVPLKEPALPLIYIITHLKWMASFATLAAFGLVWPRDNRLGWVMSGLMLIYPLVGALGIALPGLVALRGAFFLIGMPLFAWYFWRRARNA